MTKCNVTVWRTPCILAICGKDAGHDGSHRDDSFGGFDWNDGERVPAPDYAPTEREQG